MQFIGQLQLYEIFFKILTKIILKYQINILDVIFAIKIRVFLTINCYKLDQNNSNLFKILLTFNYQKVLGSNIIMQIKKIMGILHREYLLLWLPYDESVT